MTSTQTTRKLWDGFFAPPVFPGNDEKNEQARILNSAILSISAMSIFVFAGNFLGGQTPAPINWLNLLSIIGLFFALRQMRQGKIRLISIALIVAGFMHATAAVALLGTIRTPTTTLYLMLVVLAGLLFDQRGLWTATAASSLLIFGLVHAENGGWLPAANFNVTITQWVTYTVLIGFIANIILTSRQTTNYYLQRARTELDLRKKSEETLKLFSRAIENNPASIVITDVNGNIVSVNPKFTQMTGYTEEEVLGQNPRILKSGEQNETFYKNLWKTITAGGIWHGTFRNKKKNGEFYWEKSSIAPVRGGNNTITHFVAVKEDVTERKQTEEKLLQANNILKRQIAQIEDLQAELREQTIRDPLTQLHNRRYLEEILKKEYSRSQREGYPVSLVMLDMDHLKTINDTGGHSIGDGAIRRLADHLAHYTRISDTVCRLGGDEFAVVMPKTASLDALKRAEDWNKKIQEITLLHIENQTLHITFTAGVASYPDHGKTMEEVLNYADVALYRAKAKGRNRVELFEE